MTFHPTIRSFIILFLLTYVQASVSQVKKVTNDYQSWLHYYSQIQLKNRVFITADAGYRWKEFYTEPSQYIIRTGLAYSVTDGVDISAGFAHLGFYTNDAVTKIEYRPYQDISLKKNYSQITVNHRYRVEERFFYTPESKQSSFNFRFRYSILVTIPVIKISEESAKQINLTVGNELFMNAGNEIVYNVFDQNRFIISPNIQLNKSLNVAFTWNNQFAAVNSPSVYKHSHIFWVQVRQKFKLIEN